MAEGAPRQRIAPTVLLVAVVAVLVGAALGAAAMRALDPRAPEPTGSATADDADWALVARAALPPRPGAPGVVTIFLNKVEGDANVSAPTPPIPVEVAVLSWSARNATEGVEAELASALARGYATIPPTSFSRALLSRHLDSLEVVVTADDNASSVVVHAPVTGQHAAFDWPSGEAYAWTAGTWEKVEAPFATILARPRGAA